MCILFTNPSLRPNFNPSIPEIFTLLSISGSGSGSDSGAGSVITKNVKKKYLALTRDHQ